MILAENQKLYGFTVKKVRKSEELHGQTVLLEHDRTGAGLFRLRSGHCPKIIPAYSISWNTACCAGAKSIR